MERRLKICDSCDIDEVVRYELSLGYDRRTGKQNVKYEYDVEYEIDNDGSDYMEVEAFTSEEAERLACEIIERDNWNIDDFEILSITKGCEAW